MAESVAMITAFWTWASQRVQVVAVCALFCSAGDVSAQSAFGAAITVNDRAITSFELEQREALFSALGFPGNAAVLARETLIDDRLRLDAAKTLGVTISEEAFQTALGDFAERSAIDVDSLLSQLADRGIDPQTVRDFLRPNLLWSEVIGARFAARVQVTEAEVDRAVAQTTDRGGVRALLTEIVLPLVPESVAGENFALAQELSESNLSQAEFEQTARRLSASATRNNGGRLDWVELSDLPPEIGTLILGLSPGDTAAPIPTPQAVIVFQLRALAEAPPGQAQDGALDFVAIQLPAAGAIARSQSLIETADSCDDLPGLTADLPEELFSREALAPVDIPTDIALELAQLDAGESSTRLQRNGGQTVLYLMLCGRTAAAAEDVPREQIRNQLRAAKIQQLAESFLAELRSDATIVVR
ncbi:MAG: peptidylprolyl isomerase [Pseudomonadota bacterium]